MHQLEIGQGRLVERAPVDDPVVAVDPAPLVEVDEEPHHRADVTLVHREPLPPVVHRGAERAQLLEDRPSRLFEPRPRALDERLAPEVLARLPLCGELLLDHVLGRDAGVVVPGLEERVEAAHPVPADQDVLDRAVERMPEMELAGHVRRREADRVGGARIVGLGVVEALVLPGPLPTLLDAVRVVERLHRAQSY